MTRSALALASAISMLLAAGIAAADYKVVKPGQQPPPQPQPQYEPPRPQPRAQSKTKKSPAQPQAKPPKKVVVPDSRGWTLKQAMARLGSKDKGVRLAALYRVGREPGAKYQKVVAKVARKDKEARIRYEAVRGLGLRGEPASLNTLAWIANYDKDPRVRAIASSAHLRIRTAHPPAPAVAPAPTRVPIPQGASGTAPAPQTTATPEPFAPIPTAPETPVATAPQPAAPARPASQTYGDAGDEVPPGLLDASGAEEVPWGAEGDDESIGVTEVEETRPHWGFLPQLGFDGAMGSPRDTNSRSAVGVQVGYGWGRFDHVVEMSSTQLTDEGLYGLSRYTSSDLGVTLLGRWSPVRFIEVGLDLEVFTYEKMTHQRRWWQEVDGDWEEITAGNADDAEVNWSALDQDGSYAGGAFGLMSLDIKSVFVQTDPFRLGVALRATFPTHSGARFDSGLGASDIFLPGSQLRTVHVTDAGRLWGVEPGIVMSAAPSERLTIFADFTFSMAFLTYGVITKLDEDTGESEGKATNVLFIPHLGAQYRFLRGALGLQLALSPAIYVGGTGDAHFSGLAVVPGVEGVIAKHLHVSLTADVDFLGSAPQPFECTNATTDGTQTSPPTSCGLGRRVGLAFQTGWEF